MLRMNSIAPAVFVVAAIAGCFTGSAAASAAPPSIDIVATTWKFTPNVIELHVGEAATLHLTSSGGVHGLQSDDVGISLTTIEPGPGTDVQVMPKKAGTYVLHCQVFCGEGHSDMALTIHVLP